MSLKLAASSSSASAAPRPELSYAEFTALGRDGIAAAMKANVALSAGLEAIGQEVAQYARTALESAGETARALLAARTYEDVVRLQTEFARRNFDALVERSTKLSELGCHVASETFASWGAPLGKM